MTPTATSEGTSGFTRLRYTPLRDLFRGRVSGRLDVEAALTDLPEVVATLVRLVVRRTRLWRLEKAEIAAELAAHFHDGLEAGTSPEQLVKDFGDPRRAAKLIRRAKKRQRPLPWQIMRWGWRLIGLCIALYLIAAVVMVVQQPNPSTDYLAQINAPILAVPEDDRAWPIYRQAALILNDQPDWNTFNRPPRPGEDGWADVAAHISTQQEALALVRQAASRPALGFPIRTRIAPEDEVLWGKNSDPADPEVAEFLLEDQVPYLAPLRRFAGELALDTQCAAFEGDGQRVLENITATLSMAEHAREVPFMINDLVALSLVALASQSAGEVLDQYPDCLTDGQLRDLAHRFAAGESLFQMRFSGEQMMFHDVVQHMYTDNGGGDGRMTLRGMELLTTIQGSPSQGDLGPFFDLGASRFAAGPAVSMAVASRRDIVDEFDRYIAAVEAEARKPMWEMDDAAFHELVSQYDRSPLEQVRYVLLQMLMPAMEKAIEQSHKTRFQRDGVLVGIALELHRRAHGDWPATLDELVPSLLPEIPPDGFDGRPLRYVLIDGKPAVYSVGTDRVNDGGVFPDAANSYLYGSLHPSRWMSLAALKEAKVEQIPEGDWLLWPVPTEPLQWRE